MPERPPMARSESDPLDVYAQVLQGINQRFQDALVAHYGSPLTHDLSAVDEAVYKHLVDSRFPGINEELAVFGLARSYEGLREGGESFDIGVPVVKSASEVPRSLLGQDDAHTTFMLKCRLSSGGYGRLLVRRANYDSLMVNTEKPLITNFAEKIKTFQVIPLTIAAS